MLQHTFERLNTKTEGMHRLLVHNETVDPTYQVAQSCVMVFHSLHKTCSLPDVNVSHTLWHQPRPCVGARECGASLTRSEICSRTKSVGFSNCATMELPSICQFLLKFWLFGSFRFSSDFSEWGATLPTFDCLAEIREVDVVHALGSR